jgi:hypothetical protein
MKKQLVIIPLLAVALNAHAEVSVNPGDVILAFQVLNGAPGSGTDLEVDLGTVMQFVHPPPPGTVGGGVSWLSLADIQDQYGLNWSTNSNLDWGLFATDEANTIWLSNQSGSVAPQQGNMDSAAIAPMVQVYNRLNGAASTANSVQASAIAASDPGSYVSNEKQIFFPLLWWNVFPTAPDSVVTGQESSIDFYQLNPGSGPGTLLGQFELFDNGSGPGGATLAFIPVPEPPATWLACAGLGVLVLSMNRNRKENPAID